MRKYLTIEEYYKMQTTNTENNKKIKVNKLICFLILLCLGSIIFSLYTILNWYHDNSKIRQITTEINKNIDIKNNSKKGILINPPYNRNSNYYYYAKTPFYEVNLSILVSKNSDTVGFIRIRNTNVNYPVVQADDNNYYLNHSFDKKDNKAGWVFMDYRNDINNLNENTIIYGHGRLDKTLFGSLKDTLSPTWQKNKDNYVIFLSTKKENMIFQIFSIYTIKSEGYYIITNFSNKTKKQKWIQTMKERNIAPIDTEVNTNDKFLTLSTCLNNQGERIVIQAKLIKTQKKSYYN